MLAADVVLIPLADMDDDERTHLGGAPGDVVLTRMTGRARSKLVDAGTARIVERFRAPSTIVSVVIDESRCCEVDPELMLERMYPTLGQLIDSGFLVSQDAPEARRIEPELSTGATWRGYDIVRVIQALDDVDVYQADGPQTRVALKRARSGAAQAASALVHEAEVLRLLDGHASPKLVEQFGNPAALAIEWCDGEDVDTVATRLRRLAPAAARPALLGLCRSVASAYAEIHCRGVLHGDVHPRNVLVTADGTVTVIDFGLAVASDAPRHSRRAGAGYFFEPEFARARMAGEHPPPVSARGEQHVLAHLLYRLVTGHGYRDFPAGDEEAMLALATQKPVSFEHWGLSPWDDMERVLGRALACHAEDRYDDMTAFCAALASVEISPEPRKLGAGTDIQAVLARFDPDGPLFTEPFPAPSCSVTFGSAGVALFLHRSAAALDSPTLLDWATLWIDKAIADAQRCGDDAFFRPSAGLRPEVVGSISVQHTSTGLHAVRAMIARARGDVVSERRAADAFARTACADVKHIDIAFGRAGLLLTWALLQEGGNPALEGMHIDLGSRLATGLVADLISRPAMSAAADFPFGGMAHGWAGVLYALLVWSRVSGEDIPGVAVDRLDELADLAEPSADRVQWPIRIAGARQHPDTMRGWCNGSAGMVLLFALAAEMLDEWRYLELALRAGADTCSHVDDMGFICCGDVGQAYAALALHRSTRDRRWLDFAERVATRYRRPQYFSDAPFVNSLLKGPLGGQLLATEWEAAPEDARLPMFELAGWIH
ncbi:lanthionine synthetase LanC family protein [Mycolicibacterium sp. XJ1819]